MADISELLGEGNPEQLQKLLALRDKLAYGQPAQQSTQAPGMSTGEALNQMGNLNQPAAMSPEEALQPPTQVASAASDAPLSSQEALSKMASSAESAAPEAAAETGLADAATTGATGLSRFLPAGLAAGLGLGAGKLVKYIGSGAMEDDLKDSFHPKSGNQMGGSAFGLPNGGEDLKPSSKTTPVVGDNSDDDSSDDEEETRKPASKAAEILSKVKSLQQNPTKNPPPIQDTLSKLLGQNDADMQDAKEQRNKLQLLAMLGHAGAQAGAALTPLAHTMPDNTAFNTLIQAAQQPVQDIKDKKTLAMEALKQKEMLDKIDPNSQQANVLRSLLQQSAAKAGVKLSPEDIQNASPATMENIMKGVENMATHQDSAKNRDLLRQTQMSEKNRIADEKTQQEYAKRLNTLNQSSRSVIGKAAQAQVSVKRLLDIVNSPNATNQDLNSAAADLNAVVSGTTTMSGTEHQAYKTLYNDIANGLTYISGNPTAPNVPQIKKHIADVAQRMNNISDNVINNHIRSTSSGFTGWAKRHPDEEKTMLMAASDQMGGPAGDQQATSSFGQDVLDYAKKHNITPEQAQAVKKARSGG